MSKTCIRRAAFDGKEVTNPYYWSKDQGYERWSVSNIRQWLNSSSINWYSKQHEHDTPPTVNNCYQYSVSSLNTHFSYANDRGFLAGFNDNIKSHFATVKTITSLIEYDRNRLGIKYEKSNDKVFLPSITELFGKSNQSILEGSRMSYFTSGSRIRRQGCIVDKCIGTGYYRTRSIYQRSDYSGNLTGQLYRVTPSGGTDTIGSTPNSGAFEIAPMLVLY
jgi:hypothetical protein